MFDWIKSHKILIIFLFLLIIGGVPFLIHILFKIHLKTNFWVAEWEAGNLLEYYGTILSFTSTVILSILSLYQNHVIKEVADKRSKLLEQREHENNMPKFIAYAIRRNGKTSNLSFTVKNISENFARDVRIEDVKILKPDNTVFWSTKKTYCFMFLNSSNAFTVDLDNPPINEEGHMFLMEMSCYDKYGKLHYYYIKGILKKVDDAPQFNISEFSK